MPYQMKGLVDKGLKNVVVGIYLGEYISTIIFLLL